LAPRAFPAARGQRSNPSSFLDNYFVGGFAAGAGFAATGAGEGFVGAGAGFVPTVPEAGFVETLLLFAFGELRFPPVVVAGGFSLVSALSCSVTASSQAICGPFVVFSPERA